MSQADLPPGTVYVPSAPFRPGDQSAYPVTLTRADGQSTIVGFSSPELLAAAFGAAQTWFAVDAEAWSAMQNEASGPLLFNPTPESIAAWGQAGASRN